ncbi:MAG: hypothetical protein JF628_00900 [Sphingomonas sp.]|nr:hypothetical protein [Sphingomonas sp.]
MGFWSAMVIITTVAAIMIVTLAKLRVLRPSHGKGDASNGHEHAEVAALRAELGLFKDRLAVLERIATENDRGVMLDREIEKLRSLPAN